MVYVVNCEKITYYIEKGHLTKLNISEKLQVKLHRLICKCCKNYTPDSEVVNEVLSMLGKDDTAPKLSDTEKDDLKKILEGLS